MKIIWTFILLGVIGFLGYSLWTESKTNGQKTEAINYQFLSEFDDVIAWQPGKASVNLSELPNWKSISQNSGLYSVLSQLNNAFSDLGVSDDLQLHFMINPDEFLIKFNGNPEQITKLFSKHFKLETAPEDLKFSSEKVTGVIKGRTGVMASDAEFLENIFMAQAENNSNDFPQGKLVWHSKSQASRWFSRDEISADGEAVIEFKKRNGYLYGYCFINDSLKREEDLGVTYSIWDFQLPGKPQSFTIEPFPVRNLSSDDVKEVEEICNCDVKTAWKSWNTHQVYLFEQDGIKFYGIQTLADLPASSGLYPFIDDGASMYKGYQIQSLISGADVSGLYSDMFGREVSHFIDFEEQVFFFSSKDDAKSFVNVIQNKSFDLLVNAGLQELLLLSPDFTQFNEDASGASPVVYQYEVQDNGRYYHALWKGEASQSFASSSDSNLQTEGVQPAAEGTIATLKWETDLGEKVVKSPFIFTNHYTKAKEVVLVTEDHQLILVDGKGKMLWKKDVGKEIFGELHQVDIYRNNKFQLVFSTKNELHAIDRNGKDVENFPVKFDSDLSAPVSVMDYDGKRKYRFLVPLKSGELANYNKDGKKVNGWKHKKEDSPVISEVQHIIIGRKDYLISVKENGKVAIYKRDGKTRYTQDLELADYDGGDIHLISSSKIEHVKLLYLDSSKNLVQSTLSLDDTESENLGLASANHSLIKNLVDGKAKDFLLAKAERLALYNEDYELKFAQDFDQKIEPGMRSFVWNKNTYFCMISGKELHVLNSEGQELTGFPLYGESQIAVSDMNRDGKLEFITTDGEGLLMCYEVGF